MSRPAALPVDRVPAVDFYGDASSWPLSELIHCERLVERSAPHDWTIRPHRHNDIAQLFLLLEGSGRARIDSVWYDAVAPCLIVIPERAVHEFKWAKSSDGFVLSIRSNLVAALAHRIESLGAVFNSTAVLALAQTDGFVAEIFAEICAESAGNRPLKDVSLDSLMRLLAIRLARASRARPAAPALPGRAGLHYSRFVRLADEHHKAHWSVAEYAGAIGITPSHLNAICQQLTGKSTLEIVHERLVLAAQRELAYTEKNIAGVAHGLGFADPSYFSRFFKRETGMTPGEYRRRSGTHEAHA